MNEGDIITFDLPKRTLSVALSDAELKKRLASWRAPRPRYTRGVFAKYALLVSSSSLGAITTVPDTFSTGVTPELSGRTL